jgi:hypothetical protein
MKTVTIHDNRYFKIGLLSLGARGSIVGWGTMLQAGRSRGFRFLIKSLNFSFQVHYGSGFDLASNGNEYQESSWGVKGGRHVRLTTSLPSVNQWEPQPLTNLWASTACYKDSFSHSLLHSVLSYGLIFWGNSIDRNKVFNIQNKIIRIMAGA